MNLPIFWMVHLYNPYAIFTSKPYIVEVEQTLRTLNPLGHRALCIDNPRTFPEWIPCMENLATCVIKEGELVLREIIVGHLE
jgi:hypothetical protein